MRRRTSVAQIVTRLAGPDARLGRRHVARIPISALSPSTAPWPTSTQLAQARKCRGLPDGSAAVHNRQRYARDE